MLFSPIQTPTPYITAYVPGYHRVASKMFCCDLRFLPVFADAQIGNIYNTHSISDNFQLMFYILFSVLFSTN